MLEEALERFKVDLNKIQKELEPMRQPFIVDHKESSDRLNGTGEEGRSETACRR